jgi:hypothetical protein
METLQSKTIKYNDGYFTFTNVLTSSVNIPHSTRIEFFSKEKTITKWLGRYLDLDIMDTFTNQEDISEWFQSFKDETVDYEVSLEMNYNNKKFNEFINDRHPWLHKPIKDKSYAI